MKPIKEYSLTFLKIDINNNDALNARVTVEFTDLKDPVDPFGRDHLLPVSSNVFLST